MNYFGYMEFIKNHKKVSFLLLVISICLFILVYYFSFKEEFTRQNTISGLKVTPSPVVDSKTYVYEKDFGKEYLFSKDSIKNNPLLNIYNTNTQYSKSEVANIKRKYFLSVITSYSSLEISKFFDSQLILDNQTSQVKIKAPYAKDSTVKLLNIYMGLLNKANPYLVFTTVFLEQTSESPSGGSFIQSSMDGRVFTSVYNLYLNGDLVTNQSGDLRVVVVRNTITKEDSLIIPNFFPKKLETKNLYLDDFTISKLYAFAYEGTEFEKLIWYGPVNLSFKNVNIFKESGSVLYVLDFENSYLIPYISKKGKILDTISDKMLPDTLYLIAK